MKKRRPKKLQACDEEWLL